MSDGVRDTGGNEVHLTMERVVSVEDVLLVGEVCADFVFGSDGENFYVGCHLGEVGKRVGVVEGCEFGFGKLPAGEARVQPADADDSEGVFAGSDFLKDFGGCFLGENVAGERGSHKYGVGHITCSGRAVVVEYDGNVAEAAIVGGYLVPSGELPGEDVDDVLIVNLIYVIGGVYDESNGVDGDGGLIDGFVLIA